MMRDLHHLHPAARPALRDRLADIIERAMAILDALDGDPDFEPETDLDISPTSLQAVNRVPAKRITMRRTA